MRAYAKLLIAREEDLVREHEHDPIVHPSVLEAHLAELLPRNTVMVQESSTARTTLLPFGHQGDGLDPQRRRLARIRRGRAPSAPRSPSGRERPVVLHLGDGALTYSAAGFWTMARYNTAILTIVSNNETYQIVRHNWAREMPDSKMVRDGKYPGLFLGAPATDYVGLARSQGVDGEAVTTVKELEPALRRGRGPDHPREPAVPDRRDRSPARASAPTRPGTRTGSSSSSRECPAPRAPSGRARRS